MPNNNLISLDPVVKLRITVDNAHDWLQYKALYKVLVCRHHCYAVSDLSNHLHTEHSRTAQEKAAVVTAFSHLDILQPTQARLPPPLEPPIQSLGRPRDAFICDEEECGVITVSRDEVRKHCNKKHEWRSTRNDREHWHHVYVQSFSSAGGRQRYFTVDYEGDDIAENSKVLNNSLGDTVTTRQQRDLDTLQILNEWNTARMQHDRELEVIDDNFAKIDHSLWSKRTGYPQHLAGSDFRHPSNGSRLADKDEQELQHVSRLVELLVENGLSIDHSSRTLR